MHACCHLGRQAKTPSSTIPLAHAGSAAAAAQEALGRALRSLGPAAVLSVLPLNIKEGLEGRPGAEPRTWLLPLLRKHVAGAPLQFWAGELLVGGAGVGGR